MFGITWVLLGAVAIEVALGEGGLCLAVVLFSGLEIPAKGLLVIGF